MPGRPARMIRSEGCSPPMRPSSCEMPVEIPDNPPSALIGGPGHVDRQRHRIVECLETAVIATGLRQFEKTPFRVLDLVLRRHVQRRVIGDVDHVLTDGDQRAAQGQIIDRAAVVFCIDDVDGFRGEPGEVLCDRHVADLLVGGQEGLDCHRVGRLAHADDIAGDFEDLAVQRFVQMAWLQKVRNAIIGVIVDQYGAQQRLFGLDIAGRFPIEAPAFIAACLTNLSCRVAHRRLS